MINYDYIFDIKRSVHPCFQREYCSIEYLILATIVNASVFALLFVYEKNERSASQIQITSKDDEKASYEYEYD